MKKIFWLIVLLLLLISCSEKEKIIIDETTNEENCYEVIETLDVSCKLDADCEIPMNYLIQSSCPYSSKCINSKCSVICPEPFKGRKVDNVK